MLEQVIARNCDLRSSQSGEKKVLPGDDICIWEQGYLPESVFVDSLLHWFVRNGGQWEDQMQTVFIEFPDELLGLGASYEKVFEWKFRWRKTLPGNKQQSWGTHRFNWVDHLNQLRKNKHRRTSVSITDFRNNPRRSFTSLWIFTLKISQKQNPLRIITTLLTSEIHLHSLWKDHQNGRSCRIPRKNHSLWTAILCLHQSQRGGQVWIKFEFNFRKACLLV